MSELTERQKTLLLVIIRDYIDAAQPVGSKRLVDRYQLDLSSATIRNEMATLTDMGYLRQPHTSAGRVPTEEGYRYFVSAMMNQAALPEAVENNISLQFREVRPDVEQWMHLAASVLAQPVAGRLDGHHTAGGQTPLSACGVDLHTGPPDSDGGGPRRRRSHAAAPDPGRARLAGKTQPDGSTASTKPWPAAAWTTSPPCRSRQDALEQDILTLILAELRRTAEGVSGEIYTDGLTNMLAEPEFAESDSVRRAIRLLEQRSTLQALLARTTLNSAVGGLQVLIGGEGGSEDLSECSMVLARYGVPGLATGTLGVLGPMRMSYSRTIPTVRFVAGLLSDLVHEQIAGT